MAFVGKVWEGGGGDLLLLCLAQLELLFLKRGWSQFRNMLLIMLERDLASRAENKECCLNYRAENGV